MVIGCLAKFKRSIAYSRLSLLPNYLTGNESGDARAEVLSLAQDMTGPRRQKWRP
jgi:hypothetical protein